MSGEGERVYGIDLGSRSVKIAERAEGHTRPLTTCPTAEFYRKYLTMRDGRHVLERGELGLEEGVAIASTGYGRQRLPGDEAKMVPEIKAIALGVAEQVDREECVVLDIGGQDIKAIRLRKGKVADFATNDRCAASSGRYLENMSAVLGMTLEELTGYYEDPVGAQRHLCHFRGDGTGGPAGRGLRTGPAGGRGQPGRLRPYPAAARPFPRSVPGGDGRSSSQPRSPAHAGQVHRLRDPRAQTPRIYRRARLLPRLTPSMLQYAHVRVKCVHHFRRRPFPQGLRRALFPYARPYLDGGSHPGGRGTGAFPPPGGFQRRQATTRPVA